MSQTQLHLHFSKVLPVGLSSDLAPGDCGTPREEVATPVTFILPVPLAKICHVGVGPTLKSHLYLAARSVVPPQCPDSCMKNWLVRLQLLLTHRGTGTDSLDCTTQRKLW